MSRLQIVADENIPLAHDFFQALGDVRLYPGRNLQANQVRDADVLIVRSVTQVNEALLQGSRVKFVGTCTIGTDHLDIDYLEHCGIAYHSAPGCNANSVVEYIFSVFARLRPDWRQRQVGIIGCGNVGGHLYRRLQALGLVVRCFDPFVSRDNITDLEDLEAVLTSDIICMHTPLTHDGPYPTKHLLGAQQLRQLKPGCLLINAGRGPAVDNQALKARLAQRDDITAVLDVWEPEPNLDIDLMAKVALASPHIAGYSFDGKVAGTAMIYRALCRHLGVNESLSAELLLAQDISEQKVITLRGASESECINNAIIDAYDVGQDDQRMRESLLNIEDGGSGDFASRFDGLRKHYPKRREFHCFSVEALPETLPQAEKKSLSKTLATLGFTLAIREEI